MKSKAAWAVCLVVAGTALYGTNLDWDASRPQPDFGPNRWDCARLSCSSDRWV